MKVHVVHGDSADAILAGLDGLTPDFLSVHGNCEAPVAALMEAFTDTALHGATSCLGAMTGAGMTGGLACFALTDADGAYGTGLKPFSGDPRGAARAAAKAALDNADRAGERPDIVWVSATPGVEEEVLDGIISVTGPDVPIIGGSAADNTVSGNWFVFDGTGREAEGVVVSVLFPSGPVSFAYQNGYAPEGRSGVATRADGRRLYEIDGKPPERSILSGQEGISRHGQSTARLT